MKSILDEFTEYLEGEVKRGSIYVLGAQGQRAPFTDEWLTLREHGNANNVRRCRALLRRRIEDGYPEQEIGAFDCSGLGMYWLQNIKGIFKSDLNANGLKGKCGRISAGEIKRGDWVFVVDGSGRAEHIGFVADDELNVIEARGRDSGVVKGKMDGRWNYFGRPEVFRDEINGEAKTELTAVLRLGDKGKNVTDLQKELAWLGYDIGKHGADGIFGQDTRNAVEAFQRDRGIKADGIVGPETRAALASAAEKQTEKQQEAACREAEKKYTALLEEIRALLDRYSPD